MNFNIFFLKIYLFFSYKNQQKNAQRWFNFWPECLQTHRVYTSSDQKHWTVYLDSMKKLGAETPKSSPSPPHAPCLLPPLHPSPPPPLSPSFLLLLLLLLLLLNGFPDGPPKGRGRRSRRRASFSALCAVSGRGPGGAARWLI